jgi:hypothetical protein
MVCSETGESCCGMGDWELGGVGGEGWVLVGGGGCREVWYEAMVTMAVLFKR